MKYKICPYCGSNLDYGERCDCMDQIDTPLMSAETDGFTDIPEEIVIFIDETVPAAKTA